MRIIAGIAKGMPLVAPKTSEVRPTADRIREALFSSLGERVTGADVLDLFAGTGALGLEAASRGARSVVFVENNRTVLDSLQQNLATFRKGRTVACEFFVLRTEVFKQLQEFASERRQFSVVLADPPYGETAQLLLADLNLPRVLTERAVLVLESAKRDPLRVDAPWKLSREAVYGDTRVSFLQSG
jgi:16S rRNA (guanine966-N2)-methyltransferase